MISRRAILQVGISGVACYLSRVPLVLASEPLFLANKKLQGVCSEWLGILMPVDAFGPGGNSPEVWDALMSLAQEAEFERGFSAGLRVLQELDKPNNTQELTALLAARTGVSGFLNAFLDIVIEAYYGSEMGWKELGVDSPPQPLGYPL